MIDVFPLNAKAIPVQSLLLFCEIGQRRGAQELPILLEFLVVERCLPCLLGPAAADDEDDDVHDGQDVDEEDGVFDGGDDGEEDEVFDGGDDDELVVGSAASSLPK